MKPTKPHIRLNPMLGFWICSTDHQRRQGAKGSRRIQGIDKTPRAAYLRWKENFDWESYMGELQ